MANREGFMATTQQREQGREDERQERGKLRALIGERVLHTLGEPVGLYQMQVRHLWGDRFRVNVLIGADASNAKVAHSYFLVADNAGHIVAATPKITKCY
jgi:hypothetical protein